MEKYFYVLKNQNNRIIAYGGLAIDLAIYYYKNHANETCSIWKQTAGKPSTLKKIGNLSPFIVTSMDDSLVFSVCGTTSVEFDIVANSSCTIEFGDGKTYSCQQGSHTIRHSYEDQDRIYTVRIPHGVSSFKTDAKYFLSLEMTNHSTLEELDIVNYSLNSLHVRGEYLKKLNFKYSGLTTMHLWSSTLEQVTIAHTKVSNLYLGNIYNIKTLDLNNNYLESLDVRHLTSLTYLDCSYNRINSLWVDGCELLEHLCFSHNCVSLFAKGNHPNLHTLCCAINKLKALNLVCIPSLTKLNCVGNEIKSLDPMLCKDLQELYCGYNKLTTLSVTNLKKLSFLFCYRNQLTHLDISGCENLEHLDCTNNSLSSLDVSDLVNLKKFDCARNRLSTLILGEHNELYDIDCSSNLLQDLDASKCKGLYYFQYNNNPINSVIAPTGTRMFG